MKALFLISLIASVFCYQWDDARINILGSGWDILENEPRQSIYVLDSPRQSNPDDPIRTYTLPDGVVMISTPNDNFHWYSEVIDWNDDIKDLRQISVSGGASFWKIEGSFSYDYKVVREFMSKWNHKVTRVNSYTTLAKYNLQTDRLNLTDGIQKRIENIALLLKKNTTNSLNYAIYLTDEVINLYGTHVVISEDVGGILSKTDAVDVSGYQNSVDQTLSASASASFASYFKMKGSYTTEHSDVQTYSHSVTDTYVSTLGGEPWKTADTFTYDTWVDSLKIYPATIGIKLIYILDVINEQNFKMFTFKDIVNVRNLFDARLEVYRKNNYYAGCLDPKSPSFVPYVNALNIDSCKYQESFHFGGLYTTSNTNGYSVKNTITEDYRCPQGFDAKPLLHLEYNGNSYSVKHCHTSWLLKNCHYEWFFNTIVTDTYICISENNQTNGMYFGGIYTNNIQNDITQDKTCPQKYIPFPIYHDYGKSIVSYICVAPYDIGNIVSVPFGGIFSSQDPNYLVNSKPICGDGFERHPVGTAPVTELTYCIGIGSLDSQTKDLIPPGYGDVLTYQPEYYVIEYLHNGTKIGIEVNPLHNDDYETQIRNMGFIIFENVTNLNSSNCYLKKWMQEKRYMEETMVSHQNATVDEVNTVILSLSIVAFTACFFIALIPLMIKLGPSLYRKWMGRKREYTTIQ